MSTWKQSPNPYFSPTQYQRQQQNEPGPSTHRRYPSQNYNHAVPGSYYRGNEDNGRFEDAADQVGEDLSRQMRQASLGSNPDEGSRRGSLTSKAAHNYTPQSHTLDVGSYNNFGGNQYSPPTANNYAEQASHNFNTPYNAVASTSHRHGNSYRNEDPPDFYSTPSTINSNTTQRSLYPNIPSEYHRDRLTSATSIQSMSMSASTKGRRAPAPAALDLSPRSEKIKKDAANANGAYGGLGNGMPAGFDEYGRRIISEPMTGSRRPLPQPPQISSHGRRSPSSQYTPNGLPQSPSFPPAAQSFHHSPPNLQFGGSTTTSPHMTTSPSMPLTVPLSAVGRMYRNKDGPVNDMQGEDSNAGSNLDYTTTSVPSKPFTPQTPGWPDPGSIDRRGLIGVGELATPRWATSSNHAHLRTPSVPQYFSSIEAPAMPNSANNRFWGKAESGHGLGMGMMNNLQEEDNHQSGNETPAPINAAYSPPRPARHPQRSSLSSTSSPRRESKKAEIPDLAEYNDFQVDPSMEAAVASMSFDNLGHAQETSSHLPPPQQDRNIASAPPPRRGSLPYTGVEEPSLPVSPGSARARIYARRQEREKRASLSAQSQLLAQQRPPSPLQAPLHSQPNFRYTPPNSATSSDSIHVEFGESTSAGIKFTPYLPLSSFFTVGGVAGLDPVELLNFAFGVLFLLGVRPSNFLIASAVSESISLPSQ